MLFDLSNVFNQPFVALFLLKLVKAQAQFSTVKLIITQRFRISRAVSIRKWESFFNITVKIVSSTFTNQFQKV